MARRADPARDRWSGPKCRILTQLGDDFEKGPQDGATEALALIEVVARAAHDPVA